MKTQYEQQYEKTYTDLVRDLSFTIYDHVPNFDIRIIKHTIVNHPYEKGFKKEYKGLFFYFLFRRENMRWYVCPKKFFNGISYFNYKNFIPVNKQFISDYGQQIANAYEGGN